MMQRLRPLFPLVVILAVLVLARCDEPVGIITYEQPELPDGTRELVVRVTDDKNTPITGYALTITGPTSVQVNVTGNEYIFTNLANGLYTLQVSKSGFVGSVMEVPVTLPTNPKLNFFAASNVRITALAPPVPVNNAQGGTVSAPGATSTGPRSLPTIVSIPPGALGATGTTNLSVTRRPPATIVRTGPSPSKTVQPEVQNLDEIPIDSFIFVTGSTEPFNSSITIVVPFSVPQSIRTARFRAVVMSGSVATGNLSPTSESVPATVTPEGNLSFSIGKPGVYKIYVQLGLTTTNAQSPPFSIGSTDCGRASTFTVSSPTAPTVGTLFTFLSILPPVATAQNIFTVEAIVGARSQVSGINNFIDYRLLSTTGSTLETYRFPLTQVTVSTTSTNCHNSGGS